MLTPRRRAMLRYLVANGPTPWMELLTVDREIDGRFELTTDASHHLTGDYDITKLRRAGLVRRTRVSREGRDRYPFTITSAGLAALAAESPQPDDRTNQTDLIGYGFDTNN